MRACVDPPGWDDPAWAAAAEAECQAIVSAGGAGGAGEAGGSLTCGPCAGPPPPGMGGERLRVVMVMANMGKRLSLGEDGLEMERAIALRARWNMSPRRWVRGMPRGRGLQAQGDTGP